jgi:hypothetical protein
MELHNVGIDQCEHRLEVVVMTEGCCQAIKTRQHICNLTICLNELLECHERIDGYLPNPNSVKRFGVEERRTMSISFTGAQIQERYGVPLHNTSTTFA